MLNWRQVKLIKYLTQLPLYKKDFPLFIELILSKLIHLFKKTWIKVFML